VSLFGDTLVVGAPVEASNAIGTNGNQLDNSASASGAAYVFTRSGTTWSQQSYLKASNTGTNDSFGYDVSLSNDTLVVAAVFESSNTTGVNGNQVDNSASSSGAAYIFTRNGTSWSQQAYLKASNTGANDNFGIEISLFGDTLAIGAWHEDSNAIGVDGNQLNNLANNSGAVYVFTRNGTTWSQQAYLKASNTGVGLDETFGYHLSLSNDALIVGALGEDSNATGINGDGSNHLAGNSGAAYIFTRSGTAWSQQTYLKASNTDLGDGFGSSVAFFGETIIVGATGEGSNATGVNGNQADNSALGSGAAYTFSISLPTTLVNSVLPTSRTVPVGTMATIFNTVLNAGGTTASGITLSIDPAPAGTFAYQQTDCATNAIIGGLNPSLDLASSQALCYVLSFTPSATFAATNVHIRAQAANAPSTNLLTGINTWLLRSTSIAGPDIIALTTTTDFHQVACSGANAFAVALSNVGAAAGTDITAVANTGAVILPLSISISETVPATGAIIGDHILQSVGAGENRTVAVFVTFNGCVNFDPAMNRIFIEFRDANNNVVGSTSTAVSTNR
jgi:hypothetical protein